MNLFNVYQRFDIALTNGKGVYVYDNKDQQYIDMYGGHGVISIGHSHPHYVERLSSQLEKIGFYSNSINIPLQEELTEKLAEQSGYPSYQLFICNSGAEANENAIKLASFHTGKKKVIAFKGSFHGRTSAALNVTDNAKLSAPINLNNFPVNLIALNDEEKLITALKNNDVCAVIVEGIQGVGGLNAPTENYLSFLADSCRKYGAILILDEIQSGYGRSGKFFAHQYSNINADIITIAKGMGNGFPVGGVIIHPKIKAEQGMLGTTFGGNHLACTAAIAVLDIIKKEKLLDNVQTVNKYILNELKDLSKVRSIKGKGLMLGVEFDFPVQEMRNKCLYDHHIFTGNSANPNLLRILPPMCITSDQIQHLPNALKKIFR